MIYFNERPDNLGDVVIYERLATLLIDMGHEVYVNGMPLRRQDGVKHLTGKLSVNLFIVGSILKRKQLLLFSSPGGPVFELEFKWNIGYLLLSIYKKFGVKKVFSFSSLTSTLETTMFGRIIREYDFLLLRDRGSLLYYSSMFLGGQSVLVSDISFYKKQILPRKFKDEPSVGFSFRRSTPEKCQNSHNYAVLGLLSCFKDRKYFCQVVEDCVYMREREERVDFLTPENYESYYANLDIVLTNRVHVFLFALQNGSIPIMLTHKNHRKAIDLITDLGLADTIVYIDDLLNDDILISRINLLKDFIGNIHYPGDDLFTSAIKRVV